MKVPNQGRIKEISKGMTFVLGGRGWLFIDDHQNMRVWSLLLIFFLCASSKWGVTNHPYHPPGSVLVNLHVALDKSMVSLIGQTWRCLLATVDFFTLIRCTVIGNSVVYFKVVRNSFPFFIPTELYEKAYSFVVKDYYYLLIVDVAITFQLINSCTVTDILVVMATWQALKYTLFLVFSCILHKK